jgi:hypothetical protein
MTGILNPTDQSNQVVMKIDTQWLYQELLRSMARKMWDELHNPFPCLVRRFIPVLQSSWEKKFELKLKMQANYPPWAVFLFVANFRTHTRKKEPCESRQGQCSSNMSWKRRAHKQLHNSSIPSSTSSWLNICPQYIIGSLVWKTIQCEELMCIHSNNQLQVTFQAIAQFALQVRD